MTRDYVTGERYLNRYERMEAAERGPQACVTAGCSVTADDGEMKTCAGCSRAICLPCSMTCEACHGSFCRSCGVRYGDLEFCSDHYRDQLLEEIHEREALLSQHMRANCAA